MSIDDVLENEFGDGTWTNDEETIELLESVGREDMPPEMVTMLKKDLAEVCSEKYDGFTAEGWFNKGNCIDTSYEKARKELEALENKRIEDRVIEAMKKGIILSVEHTEITKEAIILRAIKNTNRQKLTYTNAIKLEEDPKYFNAKAKTHRSLANMKKEIGKKEEAKVHLHKCIKLHIEALSMYYKGLEGQTDSKGVEYQRGIDITECGLEFAKGLLKETGRSYFVTVDNFLQYVRENAGDIPSIEIAYSSERASDRLVEILDSSISVGEKRSAARQLDMSAGLLSSEEGENVRRKCLIMYCNSFDEEQAYRNATLIMRYQGPEQLDTIKSEIETIDKDITIANYVADEKI